MKTPYIIEADSSEAEIARAEQGTLILAGVTMRGRKLLAQDIDARRVVELGEAYTDSVTDSVDMKNKYYIITPKNNVRGPFASVDEAQQNIPDSHGTPMHDHVTDMKGCCSNLRGSTDIGDSAEIEHIQTWVRDDADETGYLIFEVVA